MGIDLEKILQICLVIEVAALFLIVVIAVSLFTGGNDDAMTAYAVKESAEPEKIDFKVWTKAVCEEKSEHIFCRDESFVKCSGMEHHLTKDNFENFTGCGNKKLNFSGIIIVTGEATFKKEWSDPRNGK